MCEEVQIQAARADFRPSLVLFREGFSSPKVDTLLKRDYDYEFERAVYASESLSGQLPSVPKVDINFANDDISCSAEENMVTLKLLSPYQSEPGSATTCRQATKIITAFMKVYNSFASEIGALTKMVSDARAGYPSDVQSATGDIHASALRLAFKKRDAVINDVMNVIVGYLNGTLPTGSAKRALEEVDEDEGLYLIDHDSVDPVKKKSSRAASLATWLTGVPCTQKYAAEHKWKVDDLLPVKGLYASFPELCKKVNAIGGAFYFQKAAADLWEFVPENVRVVQRVRLGFVDEYADWAEKIIALKAPEAALPRRNVPYTVRYQPREGEDPMAWAAAGGEWWNENNGDKLFETAVITRLSEMGMPDATVNFEGGPPPWSASMIVNYPPSHNGVPYLSIVATLQADPFPIFCLELPTQNDEVELAESSA